jgi:hypothetical protein
MRLSTIFSGALLAASAIAAPGKGGWGPWNGGPNCLSPAQVKSLIDGYTYLLVNPGGPDFNSTANAILTPDFQVFSDSILYLSGRPVRNNFFPHAVQKLTATARWHPSIPQPCRLHRLSIPDTTSTNSQHPQLLLRLPGSEDRLEMEGQRHR